MFVFLEKGIHISRKRYYFVDKFEHEQHTAGTATLTLV